MDFEAARLKMVDNQIRTTDVTDWSLLRAFLAVPREIFVPEGRRALAYIDGDVPLGGGRYLMEASPFAKLLQLAGIGKADTILDVGCGTGYSAAILSHLAGRVIALESDDSLAQAARANLCTSDMSVSCAVVSGDLRAGSPENGPYDVIVVEGAVDEVPEALLRQLKENGRLVAVVGTGNSAAARLFLKEEGRVSSRFGFNCSVRPLPGFQRAAEFVF